MEQGMHGGGERSVTRLPNHPSAVPTARRFASQAVSSYGGNAEILDKTRLLVTELATNAVLHAHSAIRLSIQPVRDAMRIEVRDDDPRPIPPPCRPDPNATSGRGLWLVSALSRAWGVNRNERGKTVWFEVDGVAPAH
jgi:anti-sigma regulatory factor (Ser/Thr protein kinase)